MSELPPLHPERIREALRTLTSERDIKPDPKLFERVNQSAIAALALVRKGQLVIGLSANVADGGRALIAFMEAAGGKPK
jgi:hypothetical protein